MAKYVSKVTLAEEFKERLAKGVRYTPNSLETVSLKEPLISGSRKNTDSFINVINTAKNVVKPMRFSVENPDSDVYNIPFKKGGKSVREMVEADVFNSANNNLPEAWESLWNAMVMDITIRNQMNPTIRQEIYSMISMPDATPTMRLSETFPYAFKFDENNGAGQAVTQGQVRYGQNDYINFHLYATGFSYTLLSSLFNKMLDFTKMTEGVSKAYNCKCDDLAISPILNHVYTNTAKTAADATAGANGQLKTYKTIAKAVDDLAKREDPTTGKNVSMMDVVLLCNPLDAPHILAVMKGLPTVENEVHSAITAINKVIGYDGDFIEFEDHTDTYEGVTKGTCYLIAKNRFMRIIQKRGLTLEVDSQPDVKTLTREERAWYFCEGIYSEGISSFVQEVKLPAWEY